MALPSMRSGLEGLHAQPVQGGGAVEDDGVLAHHVVQGVPDLGGLALDHLLGAFHRRHVALLHQAVVDEGLEELQGHLLGKTALVEPQVRPHGDDGAARVVDALAQQVLAEAALLSLEHVRERTQGAFVGARDGPTAPSVVEEHVDGFLQHPFLVADDDLGGVQFHEPLEAVVAVDDAPVQVVEIRGGKAPALQGNQGPQIGRDHGDCREDHPLGTVAGLAQGLDNTQTLGELFLLGVGGGLLQVGPQFRIQAVQVQLLEERTGRLGADAGHETVGPVFLAALHESLFREELLLLEGGVLRVQDHPGLEVKNLFQLLEGEIDDVADPAGKALQKPDVGHGGRQRDVAHPLAAHFRLDDLDAAFLADHPAVLHPLVASAEALVVLHGPENLRAEESVALGLEGPVVDRLGLFHLAVRPRGDLLRGGDGHLDGVESDGILRLFEKAENIFHVPYSLWLRLKGKG